MAPADVLLLDSGFGTSGPSTAKIPMITPLPVHLVAWTSRVAVKTVGQGLTCVAAGSLAPHFSSMVLLLRLEYLLGTQVLLHLGGCWKHHVHVQLV